MANKQNAIAILTAMEAGERSEIVRHLVPHAHFWPPVSAELRSGIARPLEGAEEIAAILTRGKHFAEMHPTVLQSLEDGELVVVHVQMFGRTKDGKDYNAPHLWLFRFEGDRVAELWEYADTAYAMELMGI